MKTVEVFGHVVLSKDSFKVLDLYKRMIKEHELFLEGVISENERLASISRLYTELYYLIHFNDEYMTEEDVARAARAIKA